MGSEKRILTGREKNEAAIKLLEKLHEQLRSSDASNRRRAAFNLSWMQEDGLDILKDALFGEQENVTTKNAAAYGLRKMRGRMKKMALEVLKQGLKHRDSSTRQVSRNALQLLGRRIPGPSAPQKVPAKKTRIREISHESRPRMGIDTRRGIGTRRPR
jgi:HEAT repeat protein